MAAGVAGASDAGELVVAGIADADDSLTAEAGGLEAEGTASSPLIPRS